MQRGLHKLRKRNIQAKIVCSRLLTNMLKWKGLTFSICIPLALIVQFASKLAQLDVKTTFLHDAYEFGGRDLHV